MGTSTSNREIRPHLSSFEVLGSEDSSDKVDQQSAEWVRCFVEFDNLPGDEVIDVPVVSDLPEGSPPQFAHKALHVHQFDAALVQAALSSRISEIQGTQEDVFGLLDEIGFSANVM